MVENKFFDKINLEHYHRYVSGMIKRLSDNIDERIDEKFKNFIEDNVSDGEILDSRGGERTLGDRLNKFDEKYSEVSSQLAHLVKQNNSNSNVDFNDNFLNFSRVKAYRNFYNSRITLNNMTLNSSSNLGASVGEFAHSGDLNHIIEKSGGVTALGTKKGLYLSSPNSNRGSIRINAGKINQFSTFDITIKDLVASDDSTVLAQFGIRSLDGLKQIIFSVTKGLANIIEVDFLVNYSSAKKQTLKNDYVFNENDTIRFTLAKNFIIAYLISSEFTECLGQIDISTIDDFMKLDVIDNYIYFIGGSLKLNDSIVFSKVENYISCGVGQSDPYLVTFEDKTPIFKNNKYYIAMTNRYGYGLGCTGIYEMDLTTFETKITGLLLNIDSNDKSSIRNNLAQDVVFDRNTNEFIVLGCDTDYTHTLQYGKTSKNILEGVSIVETKRLNYNYTSDDEDASLVFKDNEYHIAYCGFDGRSGFNLVLCKASNLDDKFVEYRRNTYTSFTGATWVKIGNKYYITAGKCWTKEIVDKIYIYDELGGQEKIFKLDFGPQSHNTWGCILPIYDGVKTNYFMITFDRNNNLGPFSYGSLYFYKSKHSDYGNINNKYYDMKLF